MEACSPKDGFVAQLLVSNNATVKKGDLVIQMDSEHEDRADERLASMDGIREISAAQYTPPQVDVLRSIAKAAIKLADENLVQAKKFNGLVQKAYSLGTDSSLNAVNASSNVTKAQAEKQRALDQLEKFEMAVERHNQTNALAKLHTAKEREFIAKRKERLRVLAPNEGRVKL